jgi:inosine-uridine nucleoside N-ribohydrolase
MSGSIGPNAWSASAVAEWNVKLAIPEAQAVYAAQWPLTIVPLDSTIGRRPVCLVSATVTAGNGGN